MQECQQAGVRTLHPPVSEFGMCLARASQSPPIRIMGGSIGAPKARAMLSLMIGVVPSASVIRFSIEHRAEHCHPGYRREVFQGYGMKSTPGSVHIERVPADATLRGKKCRVR